jgi:hypothetical protein
MDLIVSMMSCSVKVLVTVTRTRLFSASSVKAIAIRPSSTTVPASHHRVRRLPRFAAHPLTS